MILPLRTNITPRRTPYANYALIVLNVFIFLDHFNISRTYQAPASELRPWADTFMLTPPHPYLWQFITYAFLHGGFMHIIGNMFFLYLFGNNVNDELGNLAYLCFYLGRCGFQRDRPYPSSMPAPPRPFSAQAAPSRPLPVHIWFFSQRRLSRLSIGLSSSALLIFRRCILSDSK